MHVIISILGGILILYVLSFQKVFHDTLMPTTFFFW